MLLFLLAVAVGANLPESPLDSSWMYMNGDSLVAINSLAFATKRRFICPLIEFVWSTSRVPIEVQFLHELVPPVLFIVRPSGEPINIQLNSRKILREATCGDVANALIYVLDLVRIETVILDSMQLRSARYDRWVSSVYTRAELPLAATARALAEVVSPVHIPVVSVDRMLMMLERSVLGPLACQQLVSNDGSFSLSTRIVINKILGVDISETKNSMPSSVSFYFPIKGLKTAHLVCGDLVYALNRIHKMIVSRGLLVNESETWRDTLAGSIVQTIDRRMGCPDVGFSDGRVTFTTQHLSLICNEDSGRFAGIQFPFNVHPVCLSSVDAWEASSKCQDLGSIQTLYLQTVFESRKNRRVENQSWPRAILNL
jgi:hypothetical protein